MNQEKFNEDPFAMGSQTVEWIKSELESLRAYVEKVAERPRERVINIYPKSDTLDESLTLSPLSNGRRSEEPQTHHHRG